MAFREQLTMTTAPSGAGKTYVRCARFLVNEFLPTEEGVSWSNFPINIDAIIEHFEGKKDADEIERRIRIIPEQELKDWQHDLGGPWDFFSDKDLTGSHISIDEAHLYFTKSNLSQWQEWIGAVRHAGATVELITQTPAKIPLKIQQEAGAEILLIDSQGSRDPYFKILFADWYEIKAKLTGKYISYFVEIRQKRYGKKWKKEQTIFHARDPKFFEFYNSYNEVGKVQGSKGQQQQFEKRGWVGLFSWFYFRNFWTITLRCSAFVLLIVAVLYLPLLPKKLIDKMSERNKVAMKRRAEERAKKKNAIKPVIHSTLVTDSLPAKTFNEGLYDPFASKEYKDELVELRRVNQQTTHDYLRLKGQYETLIDRLIQARSQNDEIGMLFETWAVTRGGRIVRPGDKLTTIEGEKEIKAINYGESKITYTDDTDGWVTIGQRRLSNSITNDILQTDGKTNQGVTPQSRGGIQTGQNRETRTNHVQGHRSGAVFSPINHRTTNGRNNRSQPRTSTAVRNSRPDKSAHREGNHGSQSLPQHRASQTRRSVLPRPTPQ